jgi:hypothetical protein
VSWGWWLVPLYVGLLAALAAIVYIYFILLDYRDAFFELAREIRYLKGRL